MQIEWIQPTIGKAYTRVENIYLFVNIKSCTCKQASMSFKIGTLRNDLV